MTRNGNIYFCAGLLAVLTVAFSLGWRIGLLAVAALLLIAAVGAAGSDQDTDTKRPGGRGDGTN